LQSALQAGDAPPIAAMVSERFGNSLFDIAWLDGEGSAGLTAASSEALLADFFAQGSRPVIQGYFADGGQDVPCLRVLTFPYTGSVSYPAPPGDIGPRFPATVPADAAGLTFCRAAPGDWIWQEWVYGGYYRLAETYHDRRADWDYFVVRP